MRAEIAKTFSLLAAFVIAVTIAGCGQTRVRTDPRAKIHDNTATPAQVEANFAGKPASQAAMPDGSRCATYGSPQRVINDPAAPAWVVRVCYRGIAN